MLLVTLFGGTAFAVVFMVWVVAALAAIALVSHHSEVGNEDA